MRGKTKKILFSLIIILALCGVYLQVLGAKSNGTSQTIVTDLIGKGEANPAVFWYQLDYGSFRADYTNSAEGTTSKTTPNAGTHANCPSAHID